MSKNIEIINETTTLDQLQHFWMPSGLPCFIADRDTICDIVENIGFNIYYLLANKQTIKTVQPAAAAAKTGGYTYNHAYSAPAQPTQEIVYNSCLFKVVNNYVGRVVQVSNDELPETFYSTEEACEYTMPAIPNILVDKLDQFFRLVHSQHGTESIVLLTYDTTKTGSEGWGVLVPEQTNTPAHCSYDADSIAAIKPEHVLIVGSVHSHPEMSAYASGTDHADQADFDGLHITYGWQKSVNNGATQHYFELQMSGTAYTLKAEDVFEEYTIQKEPDPDVVEWSDKVKKVLPPTAGGSFLATSQKTLTPISATNGTLLIVPQVGEVTTKTNKSKVDWQSMLATLETEAIVIYEVDHNSYAVADCPSCEAPLNHLDVQAFSCCSCDIPLVTTKDSIFQISYKFNAYCKERSLNLSLPIAYLFGYSDTNNMFLMKLSIDIEDHSIHQINYKAEQDDYDYVYLPTDTELQKSIDKSSAAIIQEIQLADEIDPTRTICCNTPIENFAEQCFCQPAIFHEDLMAFEEGVRLADIDLYSQETSCTDCTSYYHVSCPAYRFALIDFVKNPYGMTIANKANTILPCANYESIYTTSNINFNYQKDELWENYGV